MVELINIKTRTYEYDSNFYVDIVENDTMYEAYIYDPIYTFKKFMFGVPKNQSNYEDFLDVVFNDVDNYTEYYFEDIEMLETNYPV